VRIHPLPFHDLKPRIKAADKAAAATVAQAVPSSLSEHGRKGVHRTNEGKPAKWLLAATETDQ
jgi:hypothetical protein